MLFWQYSAGIFETIDHRQSFNVQSISERKILRPFIYFPMTVFIFVIKNTSANCKLRHCWKLQHTSRKF